jgi:hypothetical protein
MWKILVQYPSFNRHTKWGLDGFMVLSMVHSCLLTNFKLLMMNRPCDESTLQLKNPRCINPAMNRLFDESTLR